MKEIYSREEYTEAIIKATDNCKNALRVQAEDIFDSIEQEFPLVTKGETGEKMSKIKERFLGGENE